MTTAHRSTELHELRERFDDVLSRLSEGHGSVPTMDRMTAALGQIAEIMRQDREELAAHRRELQVMQAENRELKDMLSRLLERLDAPALAPAATRPLLEGAGVGAGASGSAAFGAAAFGATDIARHMARGNAAREAGRLREAAEAFRDATLADPGHAPAWSDLAFCLLATNDLAGAAEAVSTALRLDGGHPAAVRAQALLHLRRGDRTGAEAACRRLVSIDPDAAQTHLTLGLLRLAGGDPAGALEPIDRALSVNPDLPEAHANRAQALLRLNRGEDALAAVRRACELRPNFVSARLLMGLIERSLGRIDAATAAFRAAIAADPANIDGHLALIETLRGDGRFEAALAAIDAASRHHPDNPALLCARGTVLQERGDGEGAIAAYRAALAVDPRMAEAHNNLGKLLDEAGRCEEAVAALEAAVAARPAEAVFRRNLAASLLGAGRLDEAEAQVRHIFRTGEPGAEDHYALATIQARRHRLNEALAAARDAVAGDGGLFEAQRLLAMLLQRTGRMTEALTVVRRLVRRRPGDIQAWQAFAGCLEHIRGRLDPTLRTEVLAYLGSDGVNHQRVAAQAAQLVRQEDGFRRALLAAEKNDLPALRELLASGRLASLLEDRLFLALLERTVVPEADFETLLTALRRLCLEVFAAGPEALEPHADFLCALAAQSHNNEFVYAVEAAEATAAAGLKTRIEAALARGSQPDTVPLALSACYHDLSRLAGAEVLTRAPGAPGSARDRLVRTHCVLPVEERAIRGMIGALTPLRSQTSSKVRQQYEHNPYPRWLSADRLRPRRLRQVMAGIAPGARFDSLPDSPDILIAGCGTGQEAVAVAQRFADAKVLAVDLSLSSLAHAIRKAREMGLTNIEFGQADLLELATLGRTFDIVESVGVLHHTADTFASWRGLVPLVRTGGLMRIGLFSRIARAPIAEARRIIAARHPTIDAAVMRRCRQEIRALPASDPLHRIAESQDFYSMSACRDLLFHVQESHHGLPEIAEWLDRMGLEFLAFEFADPTILPAFLAGGGQATDLSAWHAFETANPGTFLSMYQFWVRRR